MNIPYRRFIVSSVFLSVLGLLLFIVGAVTNERLTHAYLFWNLFLAWVPLGLALLIYRLSVVTKRWSTTLSVLFAAWLLFLPNAFYMLTDYIHVTEVAREDPVFDSVMFSVIVTLGFALGIASLLLVHKSLLRFVNNTRAQVIIGIVVAASSFAIYLGRELRFNSWDVIANPLGLTVDTLTIIASPQQNLAAYITTLTFFIVTAAVYAATWYVVEEPRAKKN